jgi:hypothetical protein
MRPTTYLHFHTVFNVRPSDDSPDPWKTLVKTIQVWMRRKSDFGDQLQLSWFCTQGRRQDPTNESQFVETSCEVGNGTREKPEFWAARMEKRDKSVRGDRSVRDRYWRTDIGITALYGNEFTIAVTVTHFQQPGQISAPDPLPSVPKIVFELQAEYWMPHLVSADTLSNDLEGRSIAGQNHAVYTIEDVQHRHRCHRIRQLRDTYIPGPDSELVDLLEAENRALEENFEELKREGVICRWTGGFTALRGRSSQMLSSPG